MKKITLFLALLLTMCLATTAFNSCGKDKDKDNPPPEDPLEKQKEACEAKSHPDTVYTWVNNHCEAEYVGQSEDPFKKQKEACAAKSHPDTVYTWVNNHCETEYVGQLKDPLTYDEGVVINGIKWATRNVDAPGTFAVKPEDAGMFYQWNRKIGWSSEDPMINSNGATVWDDSNPPGDTWEKVNDPCPAGWRVPNSDELGSLIKNTSSEWKDTPFEGRTFFGSGDNTIFLPAAGSRSRSDGTFLDYQGYYWTAEMGNEDCGAGFYFYNNNGDLKKNRYYRTSGFNVRCVAEE